MPTGVTPTGIRENDHPRADESCAPAESPAGLDSFDDGEEAKPIISRVARSKCQRKTPTHRVEYGPVNGRRSRGRLYRTLVSGPRPRNLMPPCGSPLMRTTNSVSLPVSELNASSEMIREDRGDAIPAIRSNAS